jgi:hypothetical protein
MAKDEKGKAAQVSDDPADDFEVSLQSQVETLQAQVQALLAAQSGGGLTDARLEQILSRVSQMNAEAMERAANPSNKTHPAISAFSRPAGDRADRRDDFKCPMFWLGFPMDWDTTTDEEINLLNRAEPGLFTFLRTDGRTPETLTITGERDPAGKISKLLFSFPVKENRDTLPSMPAMLRAAFKVKSPEQLELERLRAEVEALRTKATVAA